MKRWLWAALICVLGAGCASSPAPKKISAPAKNPDNLLSELTDFNGQPFTPARAKAKLRIVEFWASWCVPCREALPAMDRMYRQYKHQGLEVLAVSVDEDPNDALSIVAQLRPRFEIAWDPYGDVQTELGVNTLPTTVLLDERGEILLRLVGYTEENHQLLVHQVNMLLQP